MILGCSASVLCVLCLCSRESSSLSCKLVLKCWSGFVYYLDAFSSPSVNIVRSVQHNNNQMTSRVRPNKEKGSVFASAFSNSGKFDLVVMQDFFFAYIFVLSSEWHQYLTHSTVLSAWTHKSQYMFPKRLFSKLGVKSYRVIIFLPHKAMYSFQIFFNLCFFCCCCCEKPQGLTSSSP